MLDFHSSFSNETLEPAEMRYHRKRKWKENTPIHGTYHQREKQALWFMMYTKTGFIVAPSENTLHYGTDNRSRNGFD